MQNTCDSKYGEGYLSQEYVAIQTLEFTTQIPNALDVHCILFGGKRTSQGGLLILFVYYNNRWLGLNLYPYALAHRQDFGRSNRTSWFGLVWFGFGVLVLFIHPLFLLHVSARLFSNRIARDSRNCTGLYHCETHNL